MNLKEILKKNREVVAYLFVGGMTTMINFIIYYVCAHLAEFNVLVSTIIAWICSVLFAYIANKVWVFESKQNNIKEVFKEFCSFVAARLLTGGLDFVNMFIFVTWLGFNDIAIKILSNIVVIILNYIISKLFVFKKKSN